VQVTVTMPLQVPAEQVPALTHLLVPPPQLPPLLIGVTVQLAVSLQARVAQASLVQTIGVPTQVPSPLHASPKVQASPSLHVVPLPSGVTVQLAVPLHARRLHESLAQVIAVPAQAPAPLH
jgi:hypothetical protein